MIAKVDGLSTQGQDKRSKEVSKEEEEEEEEEQRFMEWFAAL